MVSVLTLAVNLEHEDEKGRLEARRSRKKKTSGGFSDRIDEYVVGEADFFIVGARSKLQGLGGRSAGGCPNVQRRTVGK